MKNRNFYFIALLFGLLLNSTGNKAFAYSDPVVNLDSRDYDYLQAEQNQQAVILSKVISSDRLASEENFTVFSDDLISAHFAQKAFLISTERKSLFSFLDQRYLILQHIYPFHFFW